MESKQLRNFEDELACQLGSQVKGQISFRLDDELKTDLGPSRGAKEAHHLWSLLWFELYRQKKMK